MNPNPQATVPSPKQVVAVPSDSANLTELPTRGIILTNAATLVYDDAEGNTITFPFPAGIFPVSIRKIYATGTTATAGEILLLY